MGIPVKLEVFEGPLDLLLHLIDKNKVDIYDIPIVVITDQYMEYIRHMEHEDLDVVSEFLVMAATLLDIKCRMLLPAKETPEGEEIDPRLELVEQLLQYKMYKYTAELLRDREGGSLHVLYRDEPLPEEVSRYTPPVDLDELVGDLTLARLNDIFREVLRRQEEKVDPIRSRFGKIEKEEITLDDQLSHIRQYIVKRKSFRFRDLLERQKSRLEVVVTFLAVLEMMKSGLIHVVQEETAGEILIERREPLPDPDTASGQSGGAKEASETGGPDGQAGEVGA